MTAMSTGGSDGARTAARAQFAALLPQVMADGRVDENERLRLKRFFDRRILTVRDVKEVLSQYLRSLQDEVLADGIVTEEEQQRCRAIVRELRIPRDLLTPELAAIVDGKPLPK